jgi:uncharacterized protein YbjQ (UPF0145 family)
MATRHKPLPMTSDTVDAALAERIAARREAGFADTPDHFGEYFAAHREEFLAGVKRAQQILASHDAEAIHRLGDEARQAEAEAIVADYPA